MKNIVLIGMRGTGKTSVGRKIAQKLGMIFVETDQLISEKEGKSIQQIVEEHGWEYFRNCESNVVEDVARKKHAVISSGGGIILRTENTRMLKSNGILFLLIANTEDMLARIGDDPNRPSLTGKKSRREDMEEVWKQRKKLYVDAADEIINTSVLSEAEVVKKISMIVKDKYEH